MPDRPDSSRPANYQSVRFPARNWSGLFLIAHKHEVFYAHGVDLTLKVKIILHMKNNAPIKLNSFTPAELEVMQVLWKHGELKPSEILDHIPRSTTNAALRAVLRILVDKKHLSRKLNGKAYFYKPTKSPDRALKSIARSLSDIFCGGSPASLIAHLIKHEELSDEEIDELQKVAQSKANESDTSTKGKRK